ncbi:MAG TPA: hypothetical protein VKG84_01460 [Candidatus Acidoferrales bacterium]|nr:hypothetical protein [Candidatus Acidoferrales bacterium]
MKLIVVLAIVGSMIYAGVKVVPPYVNNYQLQDTVETESRFFAAHQRTEKQAKDNVWAEVQSLSIPITQDAIKVEVIGKTAIVSVNYTITVTIFGAEVNLEFHPKSESPIM